MPSRRDPLRGPSRTGDSGAGTGDAVDRTDPQGRLSASGRRDAAVTGATPLSSAVAILPTHLDPRRAPVTRPRDWLVPLVAFGVALGSLNSANPDGINGFGLIGAVPIAAILATLVLGASFFVVIMRKRLAEPLLAFHVVALAVVISLAPLLVEHTARFDTAYLHAGFSDYIARHGAIEHYVDARYYWPGFFAFAGMLSRLTGTPTRDFIGPTNTLLALAEIPLVLGIGRALLPNRRACWLGVWVFVVANWIGQDYFAPQGINVLFLYGAFYLLLRFLRPTGIHPAALARLLPRGLRRVWSRALARERPPAALPRGSRLGITAVVLTVCGASVVSHQLTPVVLVIFTGALAYSGRLTFRSLPVLLFAMVMVWISYNSEQFWSGHLSLLFGNLGSIDSSVTQNVADRVTGSPDHLFITSLRIYEALGVWAMAAVGAWRGRRGNGIVTLGLLAVSGLPVIGLQSYGGEAALRVYLYALPAVAMFIGLAGFPADAPPRLAWRPLIAIAGLALLVVYPLARFGNESFEWAPRGDIAVELWLQTETPVHSPIVEVAPNVPGQSVDIEDHPVSALTTPGVPRMSQVESAMRRAGPRAYLVVCQTEFTYLTATYNATANSEQLFLRALEATGRFRRVDHSGTASAWVMLGSSS